MQYTQHLNLTQIAISSLVFLLLKSFYRLKRWPAYQWKHTTRFIYFDTFRFEGSTKLSLIVIKVIKIQIPNIAMMWHNWMNVIQLGHKSFMTVVIASWKTACKRILCEIINLVWDPIILKGCKVRRQRIISFNVTYLNYSNNIYYIKQNYNNYLFTIRVPGVYIYIYIYIYIY